MCQNIGKMDRFFRVIISIPLIIYGIMHTSLISLIGVVILATALLKWCGLYALIGINTCKKKNPDDGCEI